MDNNGDGLGDEALDAENGHALCQDIELIEAKIHLEKFTLIQPQPAGDNLCKRIDKEKPQVLTMRYTGGNDVTNPQEGKAKVSGDLSVPPGTVFIVASTKLDLEDSKNKIWFQDTVALGETFDIRAENVDGKTRLGSTTFVQIFDEAGGTVLQTIEFHTSCSKPLSIGDQFGGITLEGFLGDKGTTGETTPPLQAASARMPTSRMKPWRPPLVRRSCGPTR